MVARHVGLPVIGETVIRIRRPSSGTDRYGNPIPGVAVETPIAGALFAPAGSQEAAEVGRSASSSSPQLLFPRQWPDLVRTDQVRVGAEVYEVQGPAKPWRSAYGSTLGGLVVELKKVDG